MLNRRQLLRGLGVTTIASGLPCFAFSRTGPEARLVLIILRGAVDGLSVAAPYADRNYARLRGELALDAPGEPGGLLPLDDLFGLHPALTNIHSLFHDKQASVIHAVASPYRER